MKAPVSITLISPTKSIAIVIGVLAGLCCHFSYYTVNEGERGILLRATEKS